MQEIGILDILQIALKRWKLFVVMAVIFGIIGFSYANFLLPETYRSAGMIYVNNRDVRQSQAYGGGTDINDLYVAQRLGENFKIILKTDKFLKYVIEDIGIDITPKQLSSMLVINTSQETEIIDIAVVSTDPTLSNTILTSVLINAKNQLSDILEVGHIKIIEDASFEPEPIGPSVSKYTMIALVLGLMLAAALCVIEELTNTTITGEADLEKTVDIPVIGVIPDLNETVIEGNYANPYIQ